MGNLVLSAFTRANQLATIVYVAVTITNLVIQIRDDICTGDDATGDTDNDNVCDSCDGGA